MAFGMSTFNYSRELVGRAVGELVTNGSLKERLARAASQFVLAPIEDLPDDLKNDLETLQTKLVAVNSKLKETIAAMTSQEAESIAVKIVTLYGQLWRYAGERAAGER